MRRDVRRPGSGGDWRRGRRVSSRRRTDVTLRHDASAAAAAGVARMHRPPPTAAPAAPPPAPSATRARNLPLPLAGTMTASADRQLSRLCTRGLSQS